eukprot:CAMPEP_0204114228 /NCGR_PEP_ID=MMETSP0361-20130328/4132_1 /ASSEMBLY_ACC=CAM_ASM_000343 /TAXON_ID=268821 /ORGANISM="Scrippsiella Hangoei, Strain SHTV-5" /LENGTH=38 /DNA_ID= /DNA_START= /DNA_END= /DNA_ORIENTATION=
MSAKSPKALAHWPPFPQELTPALYVMVSNSTRASAMSA